MRLAQIDGLILDMDGVLYHGEVPLPGAREFVAFLAERAIPYLMLTNNSSRTPQEYAARLSGMGVQVGPERILTSAQATAMYLERMAPQGARIFVIGEEGLRSEIHRRGFTIVDDGRAVDYVVSGMDTKLTYEKLRLATLAIRAGAKFIGANPDRTFPSEEGIVPGNGATLAALEATTDVAPTIIGKPEPAIFQMALDRMEPKPKKPATIGDRLETDILGGKRAGLFTILLLCGVTGEGEWAASSIVPDMVFQDLGELLRAWKRALEEEGR